jgi:phosphocarrier protein HPr
MIQEMDCCCEARLTIGNQLGLHARVATMIVKTMQNFTCNVTVSKDGIEANAGSVLGLLLLAAPHGSQIMVRADGPDSKQAILEISRIIGANDSEEN